MITPRVRQIMAAMTGRQAAQVNDNALRDAVRSTLIDIATKAGHPLTTPQVPGYVHSVLNAASHTLIFEAEVPVALEMGAAGELDASANLTQANASRWVNVYAVCGDRRAAQLQISIDSARDRARLDSVTKDEQRRDYDENGLARAWDAYLQDGWTFCTGYAAAIYNKLDKGSVRQLLGSHGIAAAKAAALVSIRRDLPRLYRSAPDPEVEASDHFSPFFKAAIVHAYFDALRSAGLAPFKTAAA